VEVQVKAFCILLLALDGSVLAASFFKTDLWAYEVCRHAFGLCDDPLVSGLALLACGAMIIALKEAGWTS
jgi:hypothetical protein